MAPRMAAAAADRAVPLAVLTGALPLPQAPIVDSGRLVARRDRDPARWWQREDEPSRGDSIGLMGDSRWTCDEPSIARDPEDKEIVGADGIVKLVMANVLPGVSETMGAKQMHKTQMEEPPPSTDSPGAVRTPMREGTGVSAGRRD